MTTDRRTGYVSASQRPPTRNDDYNATTETNDLRANLDSTVDIPDKEAPDGSSPRAIEDSLRAERIANDEVRDGLR
jgi:hypothetical protein